MALAVMMILLAAIGGLTATSLRSGRYVERHLADIEITRQIVAGLPARGELKQTKASPATWWVIVGGSTLRLTGPIFSSLSPPRPGRRKSSPCASKARMAG